MRRARDVDARFVAAVALGSLLSTGTVAASTVTVTRLSTAPPPRGCPGITFPAVGRALMVGGSGRSSTGAVVDYDETWTYTAGSWSQLSPKTKPPAGCMIGAGTIGARAFVLAEGGLLYEWVGDDWVSRPSSFPTSYARARLTGTGDVLLLHDTQVGTAFFSGNGSVWLATVPGSGPTTPRFEMTAGVDHRVVAIGDDGTKSAAWSWLDTWSSYDLPADFPRDAVIAAWGSRKLALAGTSEARLIGLTAPEALTVTGDALTNGGARTFASDGVTGLLADREGTFAIALTLQLGHSCDTGGQCQSGFCADGNCCDAACTGACQACRMIPVAGPGDGRCRTNTFPNPISKRSCGSGPCAGRCDGVAPECAYPAPTVPCNLECKMMSCGSFCTETWEARSLCDGAGACREASTVACGNYACGTQGCKDTCASDVDCAGYGNLECVASACVPRRPRTCSSDGSRVMLTGEPDVHCGAFRCREGRCPTTCTRDEECAGALACVVESAPYSNLGAGGRCVPRRPEETWGCHATRTSQGPFGSLFAVLVALAAVRRAHTRGRVESGSPERATFGGDG